MSRRRAFGPEDARRWVETMRKAGVLRFAVGEFQADLHPDPTQLQPRIGFAVSESSDVASIVSRRRRRR